MKNNATAMCQTVRAAVREVSKRHFWNVNVKSMKNDSIVQLKKTKMLAIQERMNSRRLMTTSWNKFEAMKIASRKCTKNDVLSNM